MMLLMCFFVPYLVIILLNHDLNLTILQIMSIFIYLLHQASFLQENISMYRHNLVHFEVIYNFLKDQSYKLNDDIF